MPSYCGLEIASLLKITWYDYIESIAHENDASLMITHGITGSCTGSHSDINFMEYLKKRKIAPMKIATTGHLKFRNKKRKWLCRYSCCTK